MSRIKWVLATLIILLTLTVSMRPARAVEIDPYMYNSLRAALYFEYRKDITEDTVSGYKSTYGSFEQQYKLDVLGNIVSRWLMTYDTGLHFSRRSYGTENNSINKTSSHLWYYYVSTTLLPKSNIPLTLYINNTRDTRITKGADDYVRTKLNYGISWRGIFRTLPQVYFRLDTNHNKSPGSYTVNSRYNFDLKKKYGATLNDWENEYYITKNKGQDTSTSQLSTNFKNRTNISRATRLTVAAAASKAEFFDGDSTSVIGMNSTLNSAPSKDFSHNHNYSFVRLSQDGAEKSVSERHFYSGQMRYRISDRMSSSSAVSVSTGLNGSPTSFRDDESMTANGTLSYRVTDHLSVSENISYIKNTSSSADASNANNLDDRSEFRVNTNVNYSNNYSWTNFSASAAAGYSETESNVFPGGSGLSTSASTNFSGITLVPWVLLGASGSYSSTRVSTSASINSSTGYNFSASNTALQKYIELRAGFNHKASSSTAVTSDRSKTTINYSARSKIIKSLPISVTQIQTKAYDYFSGDSDILDRTFNISFERVIFQGQLTANYSYKTSDKVYFIGEQHITTQLFNSGYKRAITRNSLWNISATWQDEDVDGLLYRTWSVKNGLLYQLRSWLLMMEHTYNRRTLFSTDTIENKLMLSAGRSFGLTWQ